MRPLCYFTSWSLRTNGAGVAIRRVATAVMTPSAMARERRSIPVHVARRPRGVDLKQFDARRHFRAVADKAAQDAVKRRAQRRISEMSDHEILEHARADLDGRMPAAGLAGAHKTLATMAAKLRRRAVGRSVRPWPMIPPSLPGRVSIAVSQFTLPQKPGPRPIANRAQPLQIRLDLVFLHPRIDQHFERLDDEKIEQPKPCHNNARGQFEPAAQLDAGVGANRRNAADGDRFVEQGVMERHLAPDHRRKRVVGQDNLVAITAEQNRNGGCDFIGPQHNGKGKSRPRAVLFRGMHRVCLQPPDAKGGPQFPPEKQVPVGQQSRLCRF